MGETNGNGDGGDVETKKGGKLKKFVLFAFFAAAAAALVRFFKGRRAGEDENEWQELPPPAGS
jgi:hypothetical protein